MTKRAIIIGFMLAAFIAAFTYVNYAIVRQDSLIGHYMPVTVFGLLVIIVLVLNPILAKLHQAAPLRAPELVMIVVIGLAACAVPGDAMGKYFSNNMILPHQQVKTSPAWQSNAAIEMLPPYMLAGTPPTYFPADFKEPQSIAAKLTAADRPPRIARLWDSLEPDAQQTVSAIAGGDQTDAADRLAAVFNQILQRPDLYDTTVFVPDGSDKAPALPMEAKRVLRRYSSELPNTLLTDPANPVATVLADPDVWPEHVQLFNRHLIDSIFSTSELASFVSRRDAEVLAFSTGLRTDGKPVAVQDLPWAVWKRPITFWMPLFLVMSLGVIGLSLVVHPQWSKKELLVYPIAQFADSLLPDEDGKPGLVARPLFLIPLAVLVGINMLNYLHGIWPDRLVHFPLNFDFTPLASLSSMTDNGFAKWAVFMVRISPIAVGIAYLLRSDVSLSVGISVPLSVLVSGILALYGISTAGRGGGGLYSGSGNQMLIVGAYLAFIAQMAYSGRQYYWAVLRRIFARPSKEDVSDAAIWGGRICLTSMLVMVIYLAAAGVDWQVGVLYVGLAFGLFLVMSRVLAETGIFYYMAGWYPAAFLVGLFGAEAVDPATGLILFMVSSLLLVRPQEALMPFVVTGLKMLERRNVKPSRAVPWLFGSVLLALVISVPVTLMFQYGNGANHSDGWARVIVGYPFRKAVDMKEELVAKGRYERTQETQGFERLTKISLHPTNTIMFLIGFFAIILLAAARLRLSWWPLHPVLILMMYAGAGTAVLLWHSFLLGWVIKTLILRYGGHRVNKIVTVIVMGVIAGDILGRILPMAINILYFAITGDRLPASRSAV